MYKKTNSISINILSVLIILVCLSLSLVTPVNAWFSSVENDGVVISIDIGDLKLKLYKNSILDANEIYSNDLNNKYETDSDASTTAKYLTLNAEIIPEQPVDLLLILANKDLGSTSMYVRFKFMIYVRGVQSDQELTGVTLIDYDAPGEGVCGFVLDPTTGYYYYKDATGANALLNKNDSVKMMEKFKIPLSSFANDDGTMTYANNESVYFKLIIDASVNQNFA